MTSSSGIPPAGDELVIVRVRAALAVSGQSVETLTLDGEPITEDRRVRFAQALAGSRLFSSLDLAIIADSTGTTVDWLISGNERATPIIRVCVADESVGAADLAGGR